MKAGAAALLLCLSMATAARAGLSRAQLDSVSVSPPLYAHLDPNLMARDVDGRLRRLGEVLSGHPAFVNFVDFTCTTLCGTDLELLSAAIRNRRIPLSEYRLIVIGFDPKDTPEAARAMERREIPAALWPGTVLLLPDREVVRRATAALGFHYVYDPAIDQFAHPAVVYVIGPDGALRATLSPFALAATDLRAILRSPAPQTGLFERVRLLCYAYDPATGIYSLRVIRLLQIGGILTLLVLSGSLLALSRFRRRGPA